MKLTLPAILTLAFTLIVGQPGLAAPVADLRVLYVGDLSRPSRT